MNNLIYHLANQADAQKFESNDLYHTASLDTEGFIHCCSAEQLPGVIQRYYASAEHLVLLHISLEDLESEVVFENSAGGTELFAHVYGKINKSAVLETRPLNKNAISRIALGDSDTLTTILTRNQTDKNSF